ncbi:lysosomal Pro-X carboxypeptidase-like [Anthonomus grandis grandis]|uniref:lysosomal Pro-X carboxypeptidase-like n=1 Tax=Anthonomus grandis grandis TaxID=2921223 RepID=UPI0021657747|nr:lysosomal Pro-X carboxypeptidase-like [Anthonomus grandis grandis]
MILFYVLFCCIKIILSYNYTEHFIDVPIDHFSLSTNVTFKLRYLVVDKNYIKGGPIFFYCGNEADILVFYENTGFLMDIAPIFNALVVFAEHRYYGKSMPFGASSLSSPEKLSYLTTSQALADFVVLIDSLTKEYYKTMISSDTYPVIAFGGSYGGMLAAWLRMKYPHIVLGAIAASAPLLQINNLDICESFYRVVTDAYRRNGNCSYPIKVSWEAIRNITKTPEGKTAVSEVFKLCKPIKNDDDTDRLIDNIADTYVTLAMLNYPYFTEFLTALPANPVKSFCDKLKSFDTVNTSLDLLKAISSALEIGTNFSGTIKCNDFTTPSNANQPTDYAWDFQACFELIMPLCSTEDIMFEFTNWNYENYTKECIKRYGVIPYTPESVLVKHGGKILKYASNIVFSNGLNDPWYTGGILKNISDSVVAILIPDAAHHYDLRGSNPVDSKYVIDARKFHIKQIKKWLNI